MSSSKRSQEAYAVWLDRQMRERGFTTRSLSKALRPDNPEVARRSLRRILEGERVPVQRTREQIAEALGVAETGPSDGDDDEEVDLLNELYQRLAEMRDRLDVLAEKQHERKVA